MSISNTPITEIKSIIDAQRDYFASNVTLDRKFRKEQLKKLQQALLKWEKPLCDALWTDLHKSAEEAIMTELSIVSGEIKNHLSHLRCWMKSRRVSTPLKMMPSCSRIVSEPLGCSLIMSMELPGTAIAEPVGGRNLGRLHCNPKAVTLCAQRVACH